MAISVIYQNVCRLRTRLNQLKQNVSVNNPDILCITESGLNENIFDLEIVDFYNFSTIDIPHSNKNRLGLDRFPTFNQMPRYTNFFQNKSEKGEPMLSVSASW